jgi:hypothetical protein
MTEKCHPTSMLESRKSCHPFAGWQIAGEVPPMKGGTSPEFGSSATRALTSRDRRRGGTSPEFGSSATSSLGGTSPVNLSRARICAYKALTGTSATPATQRGQR